MSCKIYMDEQCHFWLTNSELEINERIGAFSTLKEIEEFLDNSGIDYSKENQLQICKDLVYKFETENQIPEDQRMTFTYSWGVPDVTTIESQGSNAEIIARAYELYPNLELDDEQLIRDLNEDIPFKADHELKAKYAEAYRQLYCANARIEFFKTENSHSTIDCGQRGTVLKVLNNGFLDVQWDNGQRTFVNPFRDSVCHLCFHASQQEKQDLIHQPNQDDLMQTDENEIASTDEGFTMSM